ADAESNRWTTVIAHCMSELFGGPIVEEQLLGYLFREHGKPPTEAADMSLADLANLLRKDCEQRGQPTSSSPSPSGPEPGLKDAPKCSFGWLHLTDLHFGMTGLKPLWPSIKDEFFKDLDKLHGTAGPWDLVLFTGDFVQSGRKDQFQNLNDL